MHILSQKEEFELNYTDIHTFLTIVSSSSLSKAAEVLFVSQPALSHRLSALEEELGTELVIRKKGKNTVIACDKAGNQSKVVFTIK